MCPRFWNLCRSPGVPGRGFHFPVFALLVLLAGCVASPQTLKNQSYQTYWHCVTGAAQPYISQMQVSPYRAALIAESECRDSYSRFQAAQVEVVRHRLPGDRDSVDLGNQLGMAQAEADRDRVTRALMDDIRRARSN